jgi:hypothetical protein
MSETRTLLGRLGGTSLLAVLAGFPAAADAITTAVLPSQAGRSPAALLSTPKDCFAQPPSRPTSWRAVAAARDPRRS